MKKTSQNRKRSLSLRTLAEIIEGRSKFDSPILGPCIVRHADIKDEARFEHLQDEALALAEKRKIPTKDEVMVILDKRKLWTVAQEAEVERLCFMIKNAQESLAKVIPEQRSLLEGDLNKMMGDLSDLIEVKEKNMLSSAEDFAAKMAFEGYLPNLFVQPTFSKDECEYMEDNKMSEIVRVFSIIQERISAKAIKQAAVESVAQNLISLSEDPMAMFGEPLVRLTVPQTHFLLAAKNFKSIIDEVRGRVDEEMLSDPDALDEWVRGNQQARDIMEEKWGAKTGNFSSPTAIKRAAENSGNRKESMQAVQSLL